MKFNTFNQKSREIKHSAFQYTQRIDIKKRLTAAHLIEKYYWPFKEENHCTKNMRITN